MSPTIVTATDPDDGLPPQQVEITDNYVLIRDGSATHAGVEVKFCSDGTQPHVITVTGVRAAGGR